MRRFHIGNGSQAYHFIVDDSGWIRAQSRPDGGTPVIGGQDSFDHRVSAPADWSPESEATGNNIKISEGEVFYPGAGFDAELVDGQLEDVLWALRSARSKAGGRLLELGCGPGFLLRRLAEVLPGWDVMGVDPSATSVDQARARGLSVSRGSIEQVDPNEKFDAVVVMGNFQLHTDPSATLKDIAAVAVPGAEMYIDLKNPRSTPRRLARLLTSVSPTRNIKVVQSFSAHAFHGMRHGIPKAELDELFTSSGWDIAEVRTVAPRLLRFGNAHSFSRGAGGLVWRSMDLIDGVFDERAWTQVAAVRRG